MNRPNPTLQDRQLASKILAHLENIPFKNCGDAEDHIAQLLADYMDGYEVVIPPPTFNKL